MRLGLLQGTLLCGLCVFCVLSVGLFSTLPAAKPLEAEAAAFSASRALQTVYGITSSGLPHPTGSADNARVRGYLVERLRALGLEPTQQVANVCRSDGSRCTEVRNLVARIEGTEPWPALLLAAHYDSTEHGPGAGDDAAGVATVLEIVRSLQQQPRARRTVIVLLDDGEELGLFGAKAFVAEHPWAKEVGVALNFEARGNRGPTAMFETSAGAGWLIDEYLRSAARPFASSLINALYRLLPNDTDLTVFKAKGMHGLNFAFADRVWDYHTANDTAERLDPASLQHMGDQGLAVARAVASVELQSTNSDRVYFDLFTRFAVVYDVCWVLPLAALNVILALLALHAVVRRGQASMRGAGCGVVVQLAAVALGGLVVLVLPTLFAALSDQRKPWWADPVPTWLALLVAGFAAASLVEIWLSHRLAHTMGPTIGPTIGPGRTGAVAALWAGSCVLWTVLSLSVALIAPGASYLFTLPALALAVGLLLAASPRAEASNWYLFVGLSLVVGVTTLLWAPTVWVLRIMVGSMLPSAAALPIALIATAAAPALVAVSAPIRRRTSVAALATTVMVSPFTG